MKTKNNLNQHCPEVEELMEGKLPFITRHGITLIVTALVVLIFILIASNNVLGLMMMEMIHHVFERLFNDYTSSILSSSQPTNCITILCICVPWRRASTLGASA